MSEDTNTSSAVDETAQASEATSDDTTDSSSDQGETAAVEAKVAELQNKPVLTKQEVKTLNKLKLKIDGREVEETLPFSIPNDPKSIEYATRNLQLAKASQARMGESAELKKQVAGFIEELRKNPKKILSDPNIGIDVKKFAAQILQEEIEASKKSPEQLEREKLETKLKELEDERKKEKEDMQKQQFELYQNQAYEEYDRDITNAIAESSLPKSSYTVKKIADYMLLGLQEGIDVKAADVIPLVEQEIRNDLKEMFAILPEDVIESLVGKDAIGKIRKSNVAKAKKVLTGSGSTKGVDVGKGKEVESKPVKKMTLREYLKV